MDDLDFCILTYKETCVGCGQVLEVEADNLKDAHALLEGDHDWTRNSEGEWLCAVCSKKQEKTPTLDTEEPSVEDLIEWMHEGGCYTPCGCWVEPDGVCPHGQKSG